MDLDFAIFDWTQKIASLLKFRSKDKFYVVFAFFSFCIFLRFPPLTFDVLLFQCSARATSCCEKWTVYAARNTTVGQCSCTISTKSTIYNILTIYNIIYKIQDVPPLKVSDYIW